MLNSFQPLGSRVGKQHSSWNGKQNLTRTVASEPGRKLEGMDV